MAGAHTEIRPNNNSQYPLIFIRHNNTETGNAMIDLLHVIIDLQHDPLWKYADCSPRESFAHDSEALPKEGATLSGRRTTHRCRVPFPD